MSVRRPRHRGVDGGRGPRDGTISCARSLSLSLTNEEAQTSVTHTHRHTLEPRARFARALVLVDSEDVVRGH
eukprot:9485458-Pyramimonas_sp.AAC.1